MLEATVISFDKIFTQLKVWKTSSYSEEVERIDAALTVSPQIDKPVSVHRNHRSFVVKETNVNNRKLVLTKQLRRNSLTNQTQADFSCNLW